MIMLRIQALIFVTLVAPLSVSAETFKCKNADGRIFYSDSKCPADAAPEAIIQTPTSIGAVSSPDISKRKMPSYMPDESCMQENQSASKSCGEAYIINVKQCMRERLSPSCAKHYESGPGAIQTADEGCKQEIRVAVAPCSQNGIASGKQCVQERLSLRCREQTSKFNTSFEKSRKQCEEAMLLLKKLCPSSGEVFIKCMQEHQSEIKGACSDL